eukprot:2981978-Rhodomonas_salina.1
MVEEEGGAEAARKQHTRTCQSTTRLFIPNCRSFFQQQHFTLRHVIATQQGASEKPLATARA